MDSTWNSNSNKDSKNVSFQIFILVCAAFPLWLPLLLMLGYKITGWINGNDFAKVYERTWGIELSSEWEEVCRKKSDTGFHGDGCWYSVYENVSETGISDMHISFLKGKNESIVEEFRFVAESLEIGKECRPELTRDFIWSKLSDEYGNYLIFIFCPEDNRLFLAQAFF